MGIAKRPAAERMDRHYVIDEQTGCWVWTGFVNNRGYAMIHENGRPAYAHRVSYERFIGPIANGLVVDHRCENTRCVNPDHLQLLTHRENILRSASPTVVLHWLGICKRGHDMTDERNVYRRPDNGRPQCRECIRIRRRARRLTSTNEHRR